MSTELIKQEIEFDVDTLPTLTVDLSPTQLGWLGLEWKKRETFTDLQNKELEVQNEVNSGKAIVCTGDLPTMQLNLANVQKFLASARTKAEAAKQQRLNFTGFITDNIISPAMEFEKRSTSIIAELVVHEFTQRKIVSYEEDKVNKKVAERAGYEAHVRNQYFAIATNYRAALTKHILDSYKLALTKPYPKSLAKWITDVATQLQNIELPEGIQYARQYLSDAEAMEIIDTIEAYDPSDDLTNAINVELANTYAMYEQDVKNAAAAIAATEEKEKAAAAESVKAVAIETATNNLIAESTGFVRTAKIKQKVDVMVENKPEWASAVLSAFIKNWAGCQPLLQVKEWQNLKLGQMATALGKLATANQWISLLPGQVYTGLTLEKIEK